MLALMPAIGNFAGGLIAERLSGSRRVLNWALHAAAGIVIAVIAVELMPEALAGGERQRKGHSRSRSDHEAIACSRSAKSRRTCQKASRQ